MLYDKIFPLQDAPSCPNQDCGAEMKLLRNNRFEDFSQERIRYECSHCHYRMTITTRNNLRMDVAILGGTLAVTLSVAVGMILEYNFLNTLKLIIHA